MCDSCSQTCFDCRLLFLQLVQFVGFYFFQIVQIVGIYFFKLFKLSTFIFSKKNCKSFRAGWTCWVKSVSCLKGKLIFCIILQFCTILLYCTTYYTILNFYTNLYYYSLQRQHLRFGIHDIEGDLISGISDF